MWWETWRPLLVGTRCNRSTLKWATGNETGGEHEHILPAKLEPAAADETTFSVASPNGDRKDHSVSQFTRLLRCDHKLGRNTVPLLRPPTFLTRSQTLRYLDVLRSEVSLVNCGIRPKWSVTLVCHQHTDLFYHVSSTADRFVDVLWAFVVTNLYFFWSLL